MRNTITDVPGITVGQAERVGDGWLTGVTVVVPPPGGAVAGVDVRGGGPGTRETDLLDPRNVVDRVHAVVLAGGSALGLCSVDGVVQRLLAEGTGFPVGPAPHEVVPIVPAAVVFDLGRGGTYAHHPDADLGAAAYDAAGIDVAEGSHGAGTGARVGGLKGGVGTASTSLPDGTIVGRAGRRQRGRLRGRPRHRRALGRPPLRRRRPSRAATPRPERPRRRAAAGRRAARAATAAGDDPRRASPPTRSSPRRSARRSVASAMTGWRVRSTPSTRCTTATRSSRSRPAPARLRTRRPSTRCSPPPATRSPARSPAAWSAAGDLGGMRCYRSAFPSAFDA